MRKIIFTNAKGESVTLGKPAPFFASKVEGLGAVTTNVQMQKSPYQDGATYLGNTLEIRELSIEGAITDRNGIEAHRRSLLRAFNPKLGPGILRYERGDSAKEIIAIAEVAPVFPDRQNGPYQKFLITLICPNPFWLNPNDSADELAAYEGGMTFPLQLPTIFANQSPNKSKIITNLGDVETPLEISFSGPATSPLRITNETTGEFIEVQQSLLEGERLIIRTEFERKSVTKIDAAGVQSNAFHYINLSSTFFQLVEGNNLISYSTGYEFDRSPVKLMWQERFLGV